MSASGSHSDAESSEGESSKDEFCKEVVELMISGELRGKLPKGFLAVMKRLPDDMTLKIWSYLSRDEKRRMRQVSKHWKWLWEHSHQPKVNIYELHFKVQDEKYVLSVKRPWHFMSSAPLKSLTFDRDPERVRQVFSLLAVESRGRQREGVGDKLPLLMISDGATNAELMKAVAAQKWQFRTIIFKGDLADITEERIADFVVSFGPRTNPSVFCLVFQDALLPYELDGDKLIQACNSNIRHLAVSLCSSRPDRPGFRITDEGLIKFARFGQSLTIPPSEHISLQGIANFVKAFFISQRERTKGTEPFSGTLCTVVSPQLTVKAVAQLDIHLDGLNCQKLLFNVNSAFSIPVTLEQLKETGMVQFLCFEVLSIYVKILSEEEFCAEVEGYGIPKRAQHWGYFADEADAYDSEHSFDGDSPEYPDYDDFDEEMEPDEMFDEYAADVYDGEISDDQYLGLEHIDYSDFGYDEYVGLDHTEYSDFDFDYDLGHDDVESDAILNPELFDDSF